MAVKVSKVKFQWNKSHAQIAVDKGLKNSMFQKEVAQIMVKHATPFTPLSVYNYGGNFHMKDMLYIRSTKDEAKIVYTKPYAKVQYTKQMNHRGATSANPRATDNWFRTAWAMDRKSILDDVNKARKKYAK